LSVHNSYLLSAEPNDISANAKEQLRPSGGYCGIYCLYGAMKYLGIDCDPNELIKPEYIGSKKGSSLAELKKCAVDNGLYATPVNRLSTKDLSRCRLPIIIHVKSSPTAQTYDHYELYLGTRQGKAAIYDPPRPIETVHLRTLAPKWDGSALLVSDKPIDLGAILGPARLRFALYAAITAVVVLAVRWGRRLFLRSHSALSRKKMFLLSFGQCAILILISAVAAFAYHSMNEEGLLAFGEATASIQQAHQANFIPKLSTIKARRLFAEDGVVFIDPRPEFVFKANHIEGAINIPADATGDIPAKIRGRIDKDTRIVVYSRKAEYRQASDLAVRLLSDGFTNVQIYKGNWVKWNTFKKAD
jgi:rhodanese-related sulfurtransferase